MTPKQRMLANPCPKCGVQGWQIVKVVFSNGTEHFPWACKGCGYRTAIYAQKLEVPEQIRCAEPVQKYENW